MVCGNEKREEAAPFVLWESGRTDAVDSEVKQTQFRRFIPHALFLVFLSCTLGVWWHWRTVELQRIRGEFEEYTHRIRSAIHSQFDLYALYLQGASNLFQASVEVTQEEWREYYEKTRANTLVDRLVSFNYIRFLRADELSDHIGEMRDRGLPAYTVWPAGDREAYAVLVYVEPWNGANQSIRGYDTFSEPIRRDAMEKARDRGEVQITGKVDLQQVKEEIQGWGLVLFAPVYAPMMPLHTPVERQDAIRGYVSGAFLIREFINQILPIAGVDIAFEIYDGSPHDPANRMYASSESSTVSEGEAPLITEQKTIDLNGRQWTILFHSTPVFLAGAGKLGTGWVLVVGLVISFLAYFLVFSLETTRRRALVLAYEMTTALRQSEEKYRIMTESLPIGIAIISLQKKDIVACNEQYKTWFPAVATHAQPVCQIHPCDSMAKDPCATCYLHAILETGSPQKVEETVETAQGRRTFSLLGIPIRDEGGRIVAIHETIEDITERRLAEKRLMDSREQLHAVANSANDAIIMMNDEGLVSFWNPTAERLFGYTKEEALGRDLHGLIAHNSFHEAFFDAFPEFVETGRGTTIGRTLELTGVTKEGEEIPLEISLSAILLNGRWNAVGILRDIRDRKQAEQDRIARDAAEAASYAKSQFVANMSHEIRTPMNAILGFAQVLKQDSALTPRQAEFVQIIIQGGNHLLNLINDILDLSKIESGQATLSPTTFSLYTLLGDLETIFRTRTEEKNLQFLMERSELSSALICADQGKLRQVFVNLIGN
ncbi:MAG: CHASE domain-containing protein, partial [bacterium]|nr:CHASE domain-containing protein [bacterium]